MPSYDACLVEAELRARAAYAEAHRHYHDERHLDDSLGQLDRLHDLGERERRLLCWAILWHDAIYDPQRTDNEERSAELAFRELGECGVAALDAAKVAQLICLTKGHRVEQGDGLGAVLVSIDCRSSVRIRSAIQVTLPASGANMPMWRTMRGEAAAPPC